MPDDVFCHASHGLVLPAPVDLVRVPGSSGSGVAGGGGKAGG
jgi:hypothetical protein